MIYLPLLRYYFDKTTTITRRRTRRNPHDGSYKVTRNITGGKKQVAPTNHFFFLKTGGGGEKKRESFPSDRTYLGAWCFSGTCSILCTRCNFHGMYSPRKGSASIRGETAAKVFNLGKVRFCFNRQSDAFRSG